VKTYLTLPFERSELPDGPGGDHVRTPEPLVERVVERFTDPGDVVVDPFAGFGTTLVVAGDVGREPYGVERDPERAAWIRDRLTGQDPGSRVLTGDVRRVELDALPAADLCLTSPPYMGRTAGPDPFAGYESGTETTYEAYLRDVERAFGRVAETMAPGSRVVVDVANLRDDAGVTTLAWDVADALADVFDFRGEVVVAWTDGDESADVDGTDDGDEGVYGYGYDHSYCLVFDA
jgi:tRNA G10  N-methylase Trm11